MKIESLQIESLTLDPNNARSHDDKNLRAIKGSLKEFGQRKPIVVTSNNVVIAGNGTLQAAIDLGWKKIDVVRVPADWDADKAKAFALADNRTSELGDWNSIKLAEQLIELEEIDFDIEAIGFEKVIERQEKELDEFPSFDDDTDTAYKCPKCSYEWNGSAR